MFKHILVAATVCLLAAFTAGKVTNWFLAPSIDRNLACYLQLRSAVGSKDWAVLKAAADQVWGTTTDKQLQDLAALYSEGASLMMDMGVRTFQESDSISGHIKAFLLGLRRPDKGVEAIGLLIKKWMTDPAEIAKQIEVRYNWVFAASVKADRYSTTAFWLTLFAFGLLSWQIIHHEHSSGVGLQSTVIETALSGSARHPQVASESPIVECSKCGAKNRSRNLKSGQKMVCGNCKTVLSSAS